MSATVKVTQPAPGVVTVTLDRSEKLNALTADMIEHVIDVAGVDLNPETRAVVITGRGRAFSAGGDVRALVSMPPSMTGAYLGSYARLDDAITASGAVWIAAINGLAYGGGLEIAAMCDVRVADVSATFCVADIDVGALPTGGLTWRLPRMVGAGAASWMVVTNAVVDAARARELGLVDEVVPAGFCLTRALEIAERTTGFHAEAVRANRAALRQAWSKALSEAHESEVAESVRLLQLEDISTQLRARYGDPGISVG